jgi:hypothetical protein
VSAPFENGGAVYSAQLELPLPGNNPLASVDLLANPDGDAYSNAVEMLMGTNPNQADPAGLIKMVPASGGGFSMVYQRAKDFPRAYVHAAWSTNLTTWSRAGLVEAVEADLGTVERIRVDFINAPVPAKAFLRLEIGD